MVENIAIIKEVHQFYDIKKAEKEALELLKIVELESVGTKRVSQCNTVEVFTTMFIRAVMMPEEIIFITMPTTILGTFKELERIIYMMQKLNTKNKYIEILDLKSNENYYKECTCSMIK